MLILICKIYNFYGQEKNSIKKNTKFLSIGGIDSLIVEQVKTFNNFERRCMIRTIDGQLVFNFVKGAQQMLSFNRFQATLYNTANQVL